MKSTWPVYFKRTAGNPPSDTLVRAEKECVNKNKALDLGCGAGRDTRFLLDKGFEVTAVDAEPSANKFLEKLPNQTKLHIKISDFADFQFEKYDLINSMFALPFMNPEKFELVVPKMLAAINIGGVFSGNFFGINDEWNKPGTKMTFVEKRQLDKLFKGFEYVVCKERDVMGELASGEPKHWHIFVVIARKTSS